jgi:hypothetical protein
MKTNKILAAIVIATAGISSSFAAELGTLTPATGTTFIGASNSSSVFDNVFNFHLDTDYSATALITSTTIYDNLTGPLALFGYGGTLDGVAFSSLAGGTGSITRNLSAGNHSIHISGNLTSGSNMSYGGGLTLTAVAAVPEPETYAMLLAGLGVIGAIARRRKAAAAVA